MIPGGARLRAVYLPVIRLMDQPTDWFDHALGGACFLPAGRKLTVPDVPVIQVDTPDLQAIGGVGEFWFTNESLSTGRHGHILYRQSDHLLFGCLSLDEHEQITVSPPEGTLLQVVVQHAYGEIFDLLRARDFGAVIRFWNYFPGINDENHGVERYRQFNVGRQDAFLAQGLEVIGNVPAACALGSGSGALNIAFLAMRGEVSAVENPRQVSAYHYPDQYGPRSPTFSRAGLVKWDEGHLLFISGTASIVGHETLHHGDIVAQTRESMNNIRAVVEAANAQVPAGRFGLEELAYKVYVRRPEDLESVRQEIERYVGGSVRAIYLRADVCRSDLLVEIEASAGIDVEFPKGARS